MQLPPMQLPRLSPVLDAMQRRLVLAVCLGGVCFMTLAASFTYVMDDMFIDLQATTQQSQLMREIPSVAALLVIFVAGSTGRRLGERRVLIFTGLASVLGFVLLLIAPVMPVATLGLLLVNVAHSAMIVVGLGLISAMISDRDGRASAFSTYSAVIPIAYIVMPVLAGVILAHGSWRVVAMLWLVTALIGTAAFWRWLPPRPASHGSGELLTPALAGLVLAVGVEILSNVQSGGWSSRVAVEIFVLLVAAAVLGVALRRLPNPSFSFAPLRNAALVLLLVIVMLTMFANLWFYMTLALEHVYGLTALAVAIVLIPAQFGSIVGAKLGGRLIRAKGIAITGGVLLGLNSLTLFASALMTLDSPVWLLVLIMTLYAATGVGATVALTNGIMNTARKGADGNTAAFRSAATSLGAAVSVAVMTSLVFFAGSASLHQQATASGIDPAQASELATAMRDGMTPADAAAAYALPTSESEQVDAMQQTAYLVAFRTQGLAGGAVTILAAGIFYAVRRRQEQRDRDAALA